MPRYRAVIKHRITFEEFTKRTGIDLSNTDTTKVRPVAIQEMEVNGKRSDIFTLLMRNIGKMGGSVEIQPI